MFSQPFVVSSNSTNQKFPQTKEQQEAAIQEVWEKLDPRKRELYKQKTALEMRDPFSFLDKKTWQTFFPEEYQAINDKRSFDHISARRSLF